MTTTQQPPPGAAPGGNPYGLTLFQVTAPSGSGFNVQTRAEADWYEDRRDRYMTDNHFPNVSDLMDLDRLLTFEVMLYRWSLWIGQGFDYMQARVDESSLKGMIKDYSVETRLLKLALGIDKATRDKEKGESLADYVANLLVRAKEFGYHRNDQYEMAVTKFYELSSMIRTYDRCDEEERTQLDLSQDKIFEWIRDNVLKDFDEMAAAFRANQAIWVRQL